MCLPSLKIQSRKNFRKRFDFYFEWKRKWTSGQLRFKIKNLLKRFLTVRPKLAAGRILIGMISDWFKVCPKTSDVGAPTKVLQR